MNDALLVASGIGVVRGARALLDGVDLDLRAGEILAVLGENGAGKSTLVQVLAGDVRPERGDVKLGDCAIASLSAVALARRRAVLPQDCSVSFPFTALEVVLLGRSAHNGGHPGRHDKDIAREALALADCAALQQRIFSTLSGGERARVMLARVLAQLWEPTEDSRILLLDEPAAALDIAQQHRALAVARQFADGARATVVAVLHDLNLASQYADRVALLQQGRLLDCGPTAQVLTEAGASSCFSVPVVRLVHPRRAHPFFFASPD